MIIQLNNIRMVQLIHNLHFKLHLLHKVMLNNLGFIDNFNSIDFLRNLMSYLIHFTKATNTDICISQ